MRNAKRGEMRRQACACDAGAPLPQWQIWVVGERLVRLRVSLPFRPPASGVGDWKLTAFAAKMRRATGINSPPKTQFFICGEGETGPTHYSGTGFGAVGSMAGVALRAASLGTKVTRKSPNSSSRSPE